MQRFSRTRFWIRAPCWRTFSGASGRSPIATHCLFLRAAKHRAHVDPIVTMLSEEVVDNDTRRLFEIKRRIRSLSSVRDPTVTTQRDEAMAALKQCEDEVLLHREPQR